MGDGAAWHTAGNWDLNRLPAAGDDFLIPNVAATAAVNFSTSAGIVSINSLDSDEAFNLSGGTLTLTGPTASRFDAALNFTGGTLGGTGAVSLNAPSTWSSGTISSSGGVTNNSTLSHVSNSTSNHILAGTLINAGTMQQTGTRNVNFANGTLINQAGATYLFQSTGSWRHSSGTNAVFNSGTIVKTGISSLNNNVAVNNNGLVDVQGGTLQLSGGGTGTHGKCQITAGTVLDYAGGAHNWNGTTTISGAGTLRGRAGALNVNGAAPLVLALPFSQTGGALGGSGSIVLNAGASWAAGTIGVAGGVTNKGTITMPSGDRTLAGPLSNAGIINQTGRMFYVNGTLTNEIGATHNLLSAGGWASNGGANAVHNLGAVVVNATGNLSSSVAFNTTGGLLDLRTGTLELTAGGTSTNAAIQIAGGATLRYHGGSQVWEGALTLSSTGTVNLESGTLNVNLPGTTAINLSYTQTGGSLGGSGAVAINNSWSWSAGNITIAGGVTNNSTLTISGSSRTLTGTFTNAGTINHATGAQINLSNGTIVNQAGATYNLLSGGSWQTIRQQPVHQRRDSPQVGH